MVPPHPNPTGHPKKKQRKKQKSKEKKRIGTGGREKKKAGEPEEARCQLPDALEALERSREPRRRGSASVLEGCVPLPEVIPFSGCPGTAED